MSPMSRRQLLGSIGLAAGTGLLAGCQNAVSSPAMGGESAAAAPAAAPSPTTAALKPAEAPPPPPAPKPVEWVYHRLDPDRVGRRTYDTYPEGGCMYSMVRALLTELGEVSGQSFDSFPFSMMRYGEGGVAGLGTVCGVVNGAGALFGLFFGGKDKEPREKLAAEFCTWYETNWLPEYQPAEPALDVEIVPSTSESVLCHVSLARWCAESGHPAFCPEKSERCRRLTCDGAMKVVDLLNRSLDADAEFMSIHSGVKQCLECHGRGGEKPTGFGKMNCALCHDMPARHP